jgi:2-keto-4-pentenoate hydratase
MDASAIERAAAILVQARRGGTRIDRLPADCRPASLDEALDVQAATVRLLGERVAGWKVGTAPDGRTAYGAILDSRLLASGAQLGASAFPLLGMEAEIAVRFLRDAPPRRAPYEFDEIAGYVAAFVAIEVVDSRYLDYAGTPMLERLADCMSSGALVAGSAPSDWRAIDLADATATMTFDDIVIARQRGGHPAGHPLRPAVDLANALRSTHGIVAGQVVTTGTFTGLHFARAGQVVRAEFDGVGAAELRVIG